MSENAIPITTGSGAASVASDLVGVNNYQQIKVVDATIGSTNAWQVNSDGSAQVSVIGTVTVNPHSVSGTIGASIIGAVPVTQSGAFFISGSIATVGAGTSNQSVSGTVGASIIGLTPVTITNIPSISGTVGASIIGAVPVTLYTTSGSLVSGVTSIITGTSSVLVLAAPTGVQRNYVTQILVTNGSAVSTFVDVVDNGQIIYSGYAAASGGGFSASFPSPLKQPTSGLGLYALTPTQASVVVSASGYTAP